MLLSDLPSQGGVPKVSFHCASKSRQPEKTYPISINVNDWNSHQFTGKSITETLRRIPIEVNKTVPMIQYHYGEYYALTDRFICNLGKEYCPIMYRQWMKVMIDDMDSFRTYWKNNRKIYAVVGREGIGKSYLLYLFGAFLKQRNDVRVLYLRAGGDFMMEISNLLPEMRLSFWDDGAQNIIRKFRDQALDKCIFELIEFYAKQGIQVVCIIDQVETVNVFGKAKVERFKRFMEIMRKLVPCYTSFTFNNYLRMFKSKYRIVEPEGYEINEDELLAFCRLTVPNITVEDAKNVMSLAGKNPSEISRCLNMPPLKIQDKCEFYAKRRYDEIQQDFRKLHVDVGKTRSLSLVKSMIRILLREKPESELPFYDSKVIREVFNYKWRHLSYEWLNGIAWRAIYDLLRLSDENAFNQQVEEIAGQILKSKKDHWVSGFEFAPYVIIKSIAEKKLSLPGFIIQFKDVEYFSLKSMQTKPLPYNPLLIPYDLNFDGLDFAIIEYDTLYLIQCALECSEIDFRRTKIHEHLSDPQSKLSIFVSIVKKQWPRRDFNVHEVYIFKHQCEVELSDDDSIGSGYPFDDDAFGFKFENVSYIIKGIPNTTINQCLSIDDLNK